MWRRLVRLTLTLVLATSLAGTVLTATRIASDPLIAPYTEAAADQIIAATDRMLAAADTPALLQARVVARLAETPRNWLALDALTDAERAAFQSLNADYVAKHGFPFIIAVRDNTKDSILAAFQTRIGNDTSTEFATACAQVERIAELRLKDILP